MKEKLRTTNLIEFKATNYRSIKQTTVLSMVAGKGKRNTFKDKHAGVSLLKSAIIFGANASGKSNLIRGLYFFAALITDETTLYRDDEFETDPSPFMLDSSSRRKSTTFELTISCQDKVFTYSASFDNTKKTIAHERLRVKYPVTPSGVTIYARDYDTITINRPRTNAPVRHGISETHRRLLQADKLFVATLSSLADQTIASEFVRAIEDMNIFNGVVHKPIGKLINALSPKTASRSNSMAQLKPIILNFLTAADLSISDIDVRTNGDNKEVYVVHRYRDGKKFHTQAFPLHEESHGTQKMLENVVPILESLIKGVPYIVDELDHTLHPTLLRFILQLFHSANTTAQLIMTSHDVTLMDDRDDLTKDQIFFIERLPDHSSDLYSLADFDIRNQTRNLSKRYLAGEFGARPAIKEEYSVHEG